MALYFLRYIIIIASVALLPAEGLCNDAATKNQSEGKKASVQAKNAKPYSWVNREKAILEAHDPIPLSSDIPFLDENGQPHNFEEFYGQVLLINFWATWCAPCTQEMPAIAKLQKDFKRKNFKVLAISEDFKAVDAIKEFYTTHGITNLPIYQDPKNELAKSLNINMLPTSIVVDAEGNEIARILGSSINWENEEFRQFLTDHTDQKVHNMPPPPVQTKETVKAVPVKEVTSTAIPPDTNAKKEAEPKKLPATDVKTDNKAKDLPEKAITLHDESDTIATRKTGLADPAVRRPVNQQD